MGIQHMQYIMMQKRTIVFRLLIVTWAAVICLTGCRKQPERITIGIFNAAYDLEAVVESFKKNMLQLGYVENKNVNYIYDGPVDIREALDAAVTRMLEKKPDLIFSLTTPVTLKVKEAFEGSKIPVVFALVTDPVGSGIVNSLKEPGGDFTGIQAGSYELKRLEWLLEIVPDIKRIYVPFNPDDKAMVVSLRNLSQAAYTHNIELVVVTARSTEKLLEALKPIPKDIQAVWQLPSPFYGSDYQEVVQLTIAQKKPLSTHLHRWVEKGALVSYGIDSEALGKQASQLGHSILQGNHPSVLPVKRCEYFLHINLKTAAAIGLHVPDSIIKQADTVIR